MAAEIGDRVGAISHSKDGIAYVFGFGVYEGRHPVAPEAGGMNFGQDNPRIRLDNGKIVWGCECWWGAEEAVRKRLDGMQIVERDIDAARAETKTPAAPEADEG